ncbi:MAG: 16S rRNA (cytosine(1402)-N(4))-methyltransferase RsmH [Streptococcaceae bacterium]|nr:16S rRNA (cytosine(1402)-N(4))-methyltransferase RsmH [Streptococcaceae bacterium]
MGEFKHETVLLEETVNSLNVKADGIYVDCTLGGAGHSEYLLSKLNEKGHLYAFDQDPVAIENAKVRLKKYIDLKMVTLVQSNFSKLNEKITQLGVTGVDGVVYDLGVSSPQLDIALRGFSYHQDGPLDMRMDSTSCLTAEIVVNTYPYQDLVRIFYRYGEEKFAKQIARKIEETRVHQRIKTTTELVEIIKLAIPQKARRTGGHPAKRIFQAIRIEVNQELDAIETSLEQAIELLNLNGRVSVITFHSLEDRIVKNIFKEYSTVWNLPQGIPIVPDELQPILELVNRKPILPSEQEVAENRRARSAKLRVVERIRRC